MFVMRVYVRLGQVSLGLEMLCQVILG